MPEDDVKNFKFKPLTNSDGIVKLPISTLRSIRDKAIDAGNEMNVFLINGETANIMDAISKVSYIVGAAKYYLGED